MFYDFKSEMITILEKVKTKINNNLKPEHDIIN